MTLNMFSTNVEIASLRTPAEICMSLSEAPETTFIGGIVLRIFSWYCASLIFMFQKDRKDVVSKAPGYIYSHSDNVEPLAYVVENDKISLYRNL